jgi:hypothetical protein
MKILKKHMHLSPKPRMGQMAGYNAPSMGIACPSCPVKKLDMGRPPVYIGERKLYHNNLI